MSVHSSSGDSPDRAPHDLSPSASVEASSPQNPDATAADGAAGESAASHEVVTPEPSPAAEPGNEAGKDAGNQDNAWAVAAEANAEPTPELPPLPASFDELALPDALRHAIAKLGWSKPSPVQALSFDPLIAGRDVMVQSHTGSGKTGAFCVPWLASRFDPRPASETGVQLLVLLPTRELAKQVCDELRRLAIETPVDVLPVYGGTPMNPQLTALRAGVHAVVGTPGRILDHIRRRSLDLSKVRTVVLDECDEMLSMGFLEDIRAILDQVKGDHLTALFSATIPNDIERIAKRYMKDPVSVQLSGDQVAAAEIEHAFYSVTSSIKTRDLLDVIMVEDPARAIIFCNTREETKLVASVLRREGFHAEELSSDLNQTQRERVMKLMREHKLRFLVATDVAARGIDISHVSHVFNYSFPESAEVYVHRTGRTGRAGRTGVAISLINPREIGNFYYLKLQYSSIVFSERHLPPAEQLAAERTEYKLDGISKRFPELVSPEWVLLARSLMTDPRGERVIALLLERAMRAAPRPESVIDPDEIQPQAEGAEDVRAAIPAPSAGPGETIEREQRDLREHREPREPRPSFGDRDRPRGDRDRGRGGDRDRPRFGDRDRPRSGSGRDDSDRPRRDDGERFADRPRRDDTSEPRPEGELRSDRPRRDDEPRPERPAFAERPRRDDSERPRRDDGERSFADRPRRDERPRDERPRDERPANGDNRGERRPDGFRLDGERRPDIRPDVRPDAPRSDARPDGDSDRGEGRGRDRFRDRDGRRRDRHESRDGEPRPTDARPSDARPVDARPNDDGERRRRRDRHAGDPAQLPLQATGGDLSSATKADPPTPVLATAPLSVPAPIVPAVAATTPAITAIPIAAVTTTPAPGQLPLWSRGRRGDHGSFARIAVAAATATITAPGTEPTVGDAGSEAVSGEPGDGRRKRRRRRRRGRRGEGDQATGETGEPTEASDDADDDSDEPETSAAPALATGEPAAGEPTSEPGDASESGDDRGRKRRRRRRNGRNLDARGPDNRGPEQRDNRGPDNRDNRGPDNRGPDQRDQRDQRDNRDNRDHRDARPQPERRPEPPPAPVGIPVAVPRRMAQDEIIIDIDENELEVVQSEFGGMDDEFDEFALMDRRQAVIETLQEEVELEDVSRSDAGRLIADDDDEADDDEGPDEPESADEPAVTATPSADGEASDAGESDADERKRKRRRRRKKPAPLVLPELTAPPHKDFWEVWASKYTYQDFEDGKYTPPNDVPEVADEPPPPPVLADRSASRGPRPAPTRSSGPRTSPPRGAPRPSGPDGGAPPPRVPVVNNASSEADDGEFLKVCLNLGRSHGHKAATLRGLLRDELGLEGRAIRDLTVRDVDTLFRIHRSELPRVQDALSQIRSDTPLTIAPVQDGIDALRAPPPDVVTEALAALPTNQAPIEPVIESAIESPIDPPIEAPIAASPADSASDT